VESLSPRLPRGPRGPGALYTLEFMLWPERFIKRMRATYGDTFRVRGLGFTGLGVCTPELAKEVFATDPEAFGAFAVGMKGIVGAQSLFSTFSSVHKKQRRLLNPRFHGQRTRTFAKTMQEVTRSIFAKVGRGTQV
jgi:cytochrome P450